MAVSIIDSFDYKGKKPDFARQIFTSLSEMASFSENYLPEMYIAFNLEDMKTYLYKRSNIETIETGKWREFGEGGSSGDLTNYYNKSEVDTLLDTKVDVEVGKGLSTNDYTTEEKTKLANLENYDDTDVKADITQNASDISDINDKIGNSVMQTTAQTLTGAINELKTAVDDTTLADRVTANEEAIETLNGNSTVTGSVDSKVAQGVSDANTYTDEQIALLNVDEAIKCDAMPTYDSVNDEITYVKDGVSTTIPATDDIWFYYEDNNMLMQSILIDGEFVTIASAGGVDFTDYVSKTNDVVSTYTGEEVVTNKIPDLASLHAMQTLIETEIADKVDIANIEDSLTSTSADKVLSAKQGKILNDKFADKLDKVFPYTTAVSEVANKVLKTDSTGQVVLDEYDSAIDGTSSNAVKNSAVKTALDGKVDIAQGTGNENKVMGTDSNGDFTLLSPSALGNDAENISYENLAKPLWTNVKLALDGIIAKIEYVKPEITSFTMSPATTEYEIGTTIDSGDLSFAWTLNKEVTSQTLTDCTVTVSDRTATYDADLSATKTFTLTVGDGENTATASKKVSFLNKIYWGSAAEPVQYDSAFILGLSGKKLMSSTKGSYNFNVGNNEYGYFAMPSSMKFTSAWVNGFNVDLETVVNSISFTNASGNTSTYSIVRFMQKSLGSFTAEIK